MRAVSEPERARTRWGVLALVLALAAVFAWREETSLDLGFHIASGRWILAHHAWPRLDPFTYTVADHPYIDMHGLFQIAMALAHGAAGMMGVGALRVGFIVATILLLWATARRRGASSPGVLLLGFGIGICAWEFRFVARPELASYLLLAAEFHLLQRHAEDGRARWLYAIVPLQAVWVYSHALSMFGLAVLGLYAATSLITGVRARSVDRTPWFALAAACGVTLLNPYGVAGLEFLWQLRTRVEAGNAFAESIAELVSPFSPAASGYRPLACFKLFLLTTPVLMLLRGRRVRLFDAAHVLMFGMLAATRVRNLGLFVVAALPVWVDHASALADRLSARSRAFDAARRPLGLAVAVACVAVGVQVVTGAWYGADMRPTRFGYRESPAVYPVGTVRRVRELGLRGPIFNDIGFGGYLELWLWPGEKAFIDARLEVIGESFYEEYRAIEAGGGWDAMVRRYQPGLVLVPYASTGLARRLQADPEWALIDADGVAVLFARRTRGHEAAIAAAAERWRTMDAPVATDESELLPVRGPAWPLSLFQPRHFAFEAWGRGNAMMILGFPRAARREYARALRESDPDEPVLVKNYALINQLLGRRDEAALWFRRLLELEPANPVALRALGPAPGPR
jgi:hypothetical protein